MPAASSTIGVLGTGAHLPDGVVSNDEVGPPAGVDDAWIVRKTGIHARRRTQVNEATSDLSWHASQQALTTAGLSPSVLSLIVVATSTPDSPQPPTAAVLADRLNAPPHAAAFDLNAVCSGFVFAADVARRFVAAGGYALVVGADIYSPITDPTDRKTAVLLGDGAGAAVLGPTSPGRGFLGGRLTSYGQYRDIVTVPAGGSKLPTSAETLAHRQHYFLMQGREVAEFVRKYVPAEVDSLLADHGIDRDSVRHLITHQANGRLVQTLADDLALPAARLHTTVERYGNTGAASTPITLDDASRADHIEPGDLVLLASFGGGMSIGLSLLRW